MLWRAVACCQPVVCYCVLWCATCKKQTRMTIYIISCQYNKIHPHISIWYNAHTSFPVHIMFTSATRGLPFAEPPVGPLRWAAPVPITGRWPGGSVDGRQDRSFCPQYNHDQNKVVGDEDCLYLNVYTPYLPGTSNNSCGVMACSGP